mgnify:CR=1 FL=1
MNNRTSIAYLIDVNFERGGAPISTKVLADEMKQYYDVCVIKPLNINEKETDLRIVPISGFKDSVPFMLFHPIKWIGLCKKLENIINESNFQIIHSHMPNVGMAIGLLRMLKRINPDIKMVYTDREHVAYLKLIHRIRYILLIARQYDTIVTLSDVSCQYWSRKVKNAKVTKIYNTASKEFEYCSFEKKAFSPLRIIMVGRIVSDKGWPLGIEIIKNSPEYHYTLVMSYFDENQKMEAEELVKEIENYSNVDIQYNLSLTEIRELYRQVDVLVMTSERESFGRTAVEAMSQGCAVIGTQVGGLPEVIGKEDNCLPREMSAFRSKLKFYEQNPETLKHDKEFFYLRYLHNFSLADNSEKHRQLYQMLLE